MIPGIDPKVDIAFKKVFGSHEWRHLTMALIDAVLQPAPWRQLTDLELLNPYTEQMAFDDKLSILDIKARDDQGRLFNVEMQMATGASLPQRFLYYWAQLYGSQLARGVDYSQLHPTISICFVNGRLFPERATYHRRFRLFDPNGPLLLTEELDIHLLELFNFERALEDLGNPLDFWLYFLKNGVALDADALPTPLNTHELRQAMEVLKMFSQDEMERELYEGRLKAERDAKMRETERNQVLEQIAMVKQGRMEVEQGRMEVEQGRMEVEQGRMEVEQGRMEVEQHRAEVEQRQAEVEQRRAEAKQQLAESGQQLAESEQSVQLELVKRIQLCERMLARPTTDSTELLRRDTLALREMADGLEQELG